jgi:hypothetical protein
MEPGTPGKIAGGSADLLAGTACECSAEASGQELKCGRVFLTDKTGGGIQIGYFARVTHGFNPGLVRSENVTVYRQSPAKRVINFIYLTLGCLHYWSAVEDSQSLKNP